MTFVSSVACAGNIAHDSESSVERVTVSRRITHPLPTKPPEDSEPQSVLIETSYTPPTTTNSSSPFNIPGSNRLKKKIFGRGTSAIRM
jgi:hypothetical protein